MRFYFDSKNDLFEVHDKDGTDLPDVETARIEATKALGSILIDVAGKEAGGRLAVSVRTGTGAKPIIRALAFFDVSEPT